MAAGRDVRDDGMWESSLQVHKDLISTRCMKEVKDEYGQTHLAY